MDKMRTNITYPSSVYLDVYKFVSKSSRNEKEFSIAIAKILIVKQF